MGVEARNGALDDIKAEQLRWEEEILQPTLVQSPERRETFTTTGDLEVARLYTPPDLSNNDYLHNIGFPGQYPFTRGVHATMHRGREWTMRMFAGFGTAEETNERFRYLMREGQTGLSVAFDMPTLYGYDTDSPEAIGEFGKCGVAGFQPS